MREETDGRHTRRDRRSTYEKRQTVYLDMDPLLMVLLLLWRSGLWAEGRHHSTGSQECETTAKADIMLLVDGSYSIGLSNFQTIRSFLAGMVSNFNIGPDRVQIGLVQYSRNPITEWHLNTHQTKYSLLKVIGNLPYRGGNTNTGDITVGCHTRFTMGVKYIYFCRSISGGN
ncbi:collagen alpha-1(XII) chain-like [Sander lucioperca]|uniref:collagen alpha-1(XII) chain-like n=1 Tax=Sander lucioperca TaxID=283035 RepID=UPI001653A8AE|nr:collagen alpha-1(XII) chain-like [Sander lucioperca]